MKNRDVRQMLKDDGWFEVGQRGSHVQYKHPAKPGRVTVSGHDRSEVKPGTLKSILRQAGLTK
jgi:predicted RNA binding protein YcfA (HicA-like mRNA interferase family)